MLERSPRIPLTVSRLCALLQETVEENFVAVLVEGEVSNCSVPQSGHHYFTLKDSEAQLRAVMFRSQARLLPFRLENGQQVICQARVSLYRQRGELQLIVERIEPAGLGGLQLAFEQLKRKLEGEGLFAVERKQPLPAFPTTIGVVTSPTGAAIRDLLNVLQRRTGGLRVLLAPVRVQGEGAAAEIAAAIADLNRQGEAEVLIVGRGGGSLEDLWAFNEEAVVRAIAASRRPVISAVGHETDVTLADLAADLRAPTPSAAAELVVKNRQELEAHLDQLGLRLGRLVQARLALAGERLRGLQARLRPPQERLAVIRLRRDELAARLQRSMLQSLERAGQRLAAGSRQLDALSPLATLARGYVVVRSLPAGRVVPVAAGLKPAQRVDLQFADGMARALIEEVRPACGDTG